MNNLVKTIKKYPKQTDAAILIIGFIVGANLFIFFKKTGIDPTSLDAMFEERGFHPLIPTIAGLLIGVTFYFLEFRFFKKRWPYSRSWSFILKFIIFSIVIILASLLIQSFTNYLTGRSTLSDAFVQASYFIGTDLFFSLYVYLILLGITLNFFRELGNRFGHGIIFNYLSGKYREPVEENRIFMFLDLNKSTSIAEKLGHVKYSRFLNKCFGDLSELLPSFQGEIYQYVGDEAVITWNTDQLTNPLKPLLLYSAFETKLLKNQSDYLEKFGVIPSFKASVNCGKVSVTMVGGTRKEMAFHGDVLNTASRVLELCSKLRKKMLITDAFSSLLQENQHVSTIYLKDLFLRGKNDKTSIYEPVLNAKQL